MALAKDRVPLGHGSYYGELLGGSSGEFADHFSSKEMYEFDEGDKPGGVNMISRSSSLSSPSSTNSDGLNMYRAMNNYQQHEEGGHSVISFNNFMHADGSLLSFDQDDYSILDQNQVRGITNVRLLENLNSIQTASSAMKGNHYGYHEPFGWLNSEAAIISDQELTSEEQCFNKRPHTGESMQTVKKQCTSATRKPKPKSSTPSSKDPQSIAAKNRRERISERLKILQDLVPNGSKVDLVTMLEKAISYVKFLQLQVKVLATDELWPVQGGKAPELSQVKDAIDAILASQRETNSSSK